MSLYQALRQQRQAARLPWFDKPWDLNLFVVRSGAVGLWDDWVVVCCADDARREVVHVALATGDAWRGEWLHPTHPDGCLYTLDGHYPGGLDLGQFKGRPALRQRKPFNYVRWPPSATFTPTVKQLKDLARKHSFSDIRGTHIHNRYSGSAPSIPQTNDSEGCTVLLYQHEHAALIKLVELQGTFRGSTVVSPTFLSMEDLPARVVGALKASHAL